MVSPLVPGPIREFNAEAGLSIVFLDPLDSLLQGFLGLHNDVALTLRCVDLVLSGMVAGDNNANLRAHTGSLAFIASSMAFHRASGSKGMLDSIFLRSSAHSSGYRK
jgi:hypothetical protein